MDEARRQQALIAAIDGGPNEPAWRERGLEAYRANAEASAERALATAFATGEAMVGDGGFAQLAREFRRAHPPQRGDLGEWGAALPDWIDAHAGLAPWPYLADSARLDAAIHRNERAADAAFDAASLARLESADAAALRIELMPGTALVRSRWPIVSIHRAHRPGGDFEPVREAIAAGRAENALVARAGWRGTVYALNDADARWFEALLNGAPLGDALEAAGAEFDFGAWLASAVRHAWLRAVIAPAVSPAA